MELIKDYDCVNDYQTGKDIVVSDTLSRKSMQTLRALNAHLSLSDDSAIVAELMAKPNMLNQVQEAKNSDEKVRIEWGKKLSFWVNEDGFLYYRDRVYVTNDDELNKSILEEAHSGSFTIHPSSTKMY